MEFSTKKSSKTPSETTKTTSSHILPTKVRDNIPKAVKIPKNKSSTPEQGCRGAVDRTYRPPGRPDL